jgi:hypothetical protein
LDDPWIFGVARGVVLPIEQSVAVTLKPLPPQSDKERRRDDAKDKTPRPRVVATFADGSPAIVVTGLEKGEIAWMPNALVAHPALGFAPGSEEDRAFVGAIASYIQPALVRVRERNTLLSAPVAADRQSKNSDVSGSEVDLSADVGADAAGVRVAVRSSSKGTVLIGVFNTQSEVRRLNLNVQVAAGIALDLADSQMLPLRTRGFASSIDFDVPAAGWKLIALSTSRAALDEERDAPLLKIRLR